MTGQTKKVLPETVYRSVHIASDHTRTLSTYYPTLHPETFSFLARLRSLGSFLHLSMLHVRSASSILIQNPRKKQKNKASGTSNKKKRIILARRSARVSSERRRGEKQRPSCARDEIIVSRSALYPHARTYYLPPGGLIARVDAHASAAPPPPAAVYTRALHFINRKPRARRVVLAFFFFLRCFPADAGKWVGKMAGLVFWIRGNNWGIVWLGDGQLSRVKSWFYSRDNSLCGCLFICVFFVEIKAVVICILWNNYLRDISFMKNTSAWRISKLFNWYYCIFRCHLNFLDNSGSISAWNSFQRAVTFFHIVSCIKESFYYSRYEIPHTTTNKQETGYTVF